MTILEFHEKLKTGALSARSVAADYCATIERDNTILNAYLEVFTESVFTQAEAIDRKIAEGGTPGVLWGVPIAIKDNILIEGNKASAASKILRNYTASYSATVVNALTSNGAIFLGRTNMDEFAMGSSTENSAFGPSRNPYHHDYVPGGSSGGSAVAVSSGLAMAALGSDTGGSIRQPAAFCGVVGLKPTYGSVSRYGLIAMASSLDQIGPLTQTVADAEIVFNAIRGKDVLDATSVDIDASYIKNRSVKTIGIPKEYFETGIDIRIKERIEKIIAILGSSYDVREITLPHTTYALACYYIIVPAEVSSNMARFDGIRYGARVKGEKIFDVYQKSRGEGIGIEVRRRILLGTYVLSHGYYDAYYARAQKVRTLIKKDFQTAFGDVDVILGPTTPTLPFKIGERATDPLAMYLADIYTIPANLAGVPALSLPIGALHDRDADFPIGLQLIAPHFCEGRLFELGSVIENTAKTL